MSAVFIAGSTMAQVCGTDEMNRLYKAQNPGINAVDANLEHEIQQMLANMDVSRYARKGTVDSDSVVMNIPVVVHVIHDYGVEYITDDKIYTMMDELNALYNKANPDLSQIIPTFIPYIGKGYIRFHLATKDPQGNPTRGITRKRTYLTQGGDDQSKFDLWNPSNYLNIWFINHIGRSPSSGIVAAYSNYPSSAAFFPHYDGLISNYQFINSTGSSNNTVGHEIGHYLNLQHPWGNNNNATVACGDDNVPDTPPTKGHFGGCNLYDTECALGVEPAAPDTTNVQNVMDYANCSIMFTKGQMARSRAALRSATASRSNLWSAANLANTGALAPAPPLGPIADFSVNRVFYCASSSIISFQFVNRSWNDSNISVNWSFPSSAVTTTSTNSNVNNGISQPGWADITLTATGAHGTNSVTKRAVYVADQATTANGTVEDFNIGSASAGKFPAFDYYNTGRKWEITNAAGWYGGSSMRYVNDDTRPNTTIGMATGTPAGDFSDFFTPAYDVSVLGGNAFVNFVSAGAYRGNSPNDVLQVAYSIDCGNNWRPFDSLTAGDVANVGRVTSDYVATNGGDWRFHAMNIPTAARTGRTFFRFRYKPGVDNNGRGSGNNFYLDRFAVTSSSTDVNGVELTTTGMEVAPNPTSGSAFVLLKNAGTAMATMSVTDITGKLVYQSSQKLSGSIDRIDIPQTNIFAKGIYLVRVIADTKTYTRKLVVN